MADHTVPLRNPLSTSSPPEGWRPLVRALRSAQRPLERFLHVEASSGIVLLLSAAVAFAWANSAWGSIYDRVWHTPVSVRLGAFRLKGDLAWLIDDALMVVFFFVVGLEIRRELYKGELSDWRRAALPAAAACGGMLVPALVYLAIASGPATRSGWGVPMATDIAFAVGVLALLGRRVPASLRVLLLALAVIDDLGAILVIAVFYSSSGSLAGFAVAALGIAAIVAMQRFGVRVKLAYVVPAVAIWAGVDAAGIHPTIAGVIVGLLTPVRAWLGTEGFVAGVQTELDHLNTAAGAELSNRELAARLRHVDLARREAMSPAESLIETLHPWVAFGIMPLFALANAGISLGRGPLEGPALAVVGGVALGLLIGKPVGVLVASFVALRLKIGALPNGLATRHLVVLGLIAGVGFTMSLFISRLAFAEDRLLSAAKLGVLAASGLAGVIGIVTGRVLLRPDTRVALETADEAESLAEGCRGSS